MKRNSQSKVAKGTPSRYSNTVRAAKRARYFHNHGLAYTGRYGAQVRKAA
jgi:hypothetical protein